MCGIIGAFWNTPPANANHLLEKAIALLKHRGPDDFGHELISSSGGLLGLGHTRLSIIDLSVAGRQPMDSTDGRYTMVYNGEIYNYRELRSELISKGLSFRTNTDTEVLLESWSLWGEACLSRLKGMFAFAVFDRHESSLTCVRDAFGVKPFYYSRRQDGFFFASELPALQSILPVKSKLNLQRAYDFLVFDSYDDHESTFSKGIKQLMPGHRLKIRFTPHNLFFENTRWWYPGIEEKKDLSFDSAAEQLREMFLQNIRLHLRSDVPFGANLSGGLDSASLVCGIRHLEPEIPLHTFSYVARGSPVNEEPWADRVNRHVGAISHKVEVSVEEFDHDLGEMIRIQGEPFGSTSIYAQYRVFRLAKEHGITVTLDGQGADEMLAGYNGYPQARISSLLERKEFRELIDFLREWPKWPGRRRNKLYLYLLEMLLPKSLKSQSHRIRGWNPKPAWLETTKLRDSGVVLTEPNAFDFSADGHGRRLADNLRFALTGHKLIHLLRILDRNSMHWSIESRVPFLTTDIVEFLLSLPEDYLLSSGGQTKRIFRTAMRGIVPDDILDRKDKIGFATPEKQWLLYSREKVISWIDGMDEISFLKKDKCVEEVTQILDGRKPFSWQAWRLVNFAQWHSLHVGSCHTN